MYLQKDFLWAKRKKLTMRERKKERKKESEWRKWYIREAAKKVLF